MADVAVTYNTMEVEYGERAHQALGDHDLNPSELLAEWGTLITRAHDEVTYMRKFTYLTPFFAKDILENERFTTWTDLWNDLHMSHVQSSLKYDLKLHTVKGVTRSLGIKAKFATKDDPGPHDLLTAEDAEQYDDYYWSCESSDVVKRWLEICGYPQSVVYVIMRRYQNNVNSRRRYRAQKGPDGVEPRRRRTHAAPVRH